jgi:predicted heme/steroid binding protein
MTITREELEEMDGFDGAPLYLSIKGRVYDVSAGTKFYAEGSEYHEWVGKDASRSFGTGCRGGTDRTGMDCLSSSLEGLSEKASCKLQLTTFYAFHANHEQYLQNRS